jgi:hypothetical protein
MKGGNIENNRLQLFISIAIIGYFGVKIIYGLFFNFYPHKYYNRNINITSNSDNNKIDENITLNAYVPGLWNNEMSDFITAMVVVFIIYIFTNASTKSIFNEYGNLNIAFIMGYIIGLGYPPLYYWILSNNQNNVSNLSKYILLVFSVIVIITAIVSNYIETGKLGSEHKRNYLLYCLVLILLIGGLIITKKNSENYSAVSYFNSDGDNCTFLRNGIVRTSGDFLNITAPFISFIIILLFSYEPEEIGFKNYYIMLYGILLGIIVSGISYFGMEYFLLKVPEKECNNAKECIMKKLPTPVEINDNCDALTDSNCNILIDSNLNNNNNNNNSFNFFNSNFSLLKIFMIIIIILLTIYLIYYYLSS